MRIAPWWVAGLTVAVTANAQERMTPAQVKEWLAREAKQMAIVDRAYELRPRRRDEPLRYLNLSDNEMREIQDVAQKYLAKTMLNVSPVMRDAPAKKGRCAPPRSMS